MYIYKIYSSLLYISIIHMTKLTTQIVLNIFAIRKE
jgi:hypothetical protein